MTELLKSWNVVIVAKPVNLPKISEITLTSVNLKVCKFNLNKFVFFFLKKSNRHAVMFPEKRNPVQET